MRYRIRETGAIVYLNELLALYPNTSFPSVITPELIDELGADPVLEGPQPTLTENQYSRFDGVTEINGQWFTKYIAVDYTAEELAAKLEQWRQSTSCTPFQGRMALSDAGLLANVETAVAAADEKTKVAWEYALEWKRSSPLIATLATALNMTEIQIDDLFKNAATITA